MRRFPLIAAVMILAATLLAGRGAWAHEYWIEPSTTRVAPGQAVTFRLRVGDGPPGEPRPRSAEHLLRFDFVRPDGSVQFVEGAPGEDPAGSVLLDAPGTYVVFYQSHPIEIEIAPERFETYLTHVGLERIRDLRRERGKSSTPGRERYARCAKTILGAGPSSGVGYDRKVGLPLELVPVDDPLTLEPGAELGLQALLHGKPLPALLLLVFERESGLVARVRTDAEGLAVIGLDRAGDWIVSGVHMWEEATPTTDWASLWTSFTFSVVEPASAPSSP